jgi:hypothetical protein
MSPAIETIAASVLDARREVVVKLLATDEGRELARLDDAYRALTGHAPPPWHEPAATEPAAKSPVPINRGGRALGGRSVRARVQHILDEGPRRWDYDLIAAEMEQRGWETKGSKNDAKSSLRTAVWTIVNNGHAERSPSGGEFWSSKFSAEIKDAEIKDDVRTREYLEEQAHQACAWGPDTSQVGEHQLE